MNLSKTEYSQKTYCFVSNYLTPHQLPFCLEMSRLSGGKFVFVETERLPGDRIELGYPDFSEEYDFVLSAYKGESEYNEALKIAYESDVTIIGSAPDVFINRRLSEDKLTFRFSERIFKKRYFDPPRWLKYTLKNAKYRNKNLYFLLSSAYAPHDYLRCGVRKDKMFKWGYFPASHEGDPTYEGKIHNRCLWTGRYIDWKHPDQAIKAVVRLHDEGYDVSLDLIGAGDMEDTLRDIITSSNAEAYIRMLGHKPYDEVRDYMYQSEIFLFTSDYNEGWGAVLNEAMDSGCAIISSHSTGSAPYLIKHGVNGLLYRYGDSDQLYDELKKLVSDDDTSRVMGKNARQTITSEWNATVASERLVEFCEAFYRGDYTSAIKDEGVMSRAEAIKQSDMYDYVTRG